MSAFVGAWNIGSLFLWWLHAVDSSRKRKGGGSLNITLQLGKCSKFDYLFLQEGLKIERP